MPEVLFVILHFLVCTLLICGVLLCLQSAENKRPRIYLAIFMFITASELSYRLYVAYRTGVLSTVNQILPIYVLVSGIAEIMLMYLYPLEVIKPNWITPKRLFLLFLPWLILGCVSVLIYPYFRDLSSFSDMMQHVGEFNVWFRLLLLFLCFIPYTIPLLRIPHRWQQSSVDNKWIYKYVICIQIVGLLFSTVVLTGYVWVSCIHLLYGILFVLYVTYQELYLRLFPTSVNKAMTPEMVAEITSINDSTQRDEAATHNLLWENIMLQMNEKELWRNPDLTLEDLSKSSCTNRTTLSMLIQQRSFSGYSEFINRRRIEAFTEAVNSSKSFNIDMQQLFYEAGFRSRSTAMRNFRLYMGCTPGEYIQRIAERKKGIANSVEDSFRE